MITGEYTYTNYNFIYFAIILIVVLLIIIFRKKIIDFFKKNKLFGSIYKLSFFLYIIIIIRSIIAAYTGVKIISDEYTYGIKAFLLFLYIYTVFIPIIPITALYQILYIIVRKLKNRNKPTK